MALLPQAGHESETEFKLGVEVEGNLDDEENGKSADHEWRMAVSKGHEPSHINSQLLAHTQTPGNLAPTNAQPSLWRPA